jgi:hypothetical protein
MTHLILELIPVLIYQNPQFFSKLKLEANVKVGDVDPHNLKITLAKSHSVQNHIKDV